MDLPPLIRHFLNQLLADGRWLKFRRWTLWGSGAIAALTLLLHLAPGNPRQVDFLDLLLLLPTAFAGCCLVVALYDEMPRARRERVLELIDLSGSNPLVNWLYKAGVALALAITSISAIIPALLISTGCNGMPPGIAGIHFLISCLFLIYLLSAVLLGSARAVESGVSILSIIALILFSSLLIPWLMESIGKATGVPWLDDRWYWSSPVLALFSALTPAALHAGSLKLLMGGMFFWTILHTFLAWRIFRMKKPGPSPYVPRSRRPFFNRLARILMDDGQPRGDNPLSHLIQRERINVLSAWGITALAVTLLLVLLAVHGPLWFTSFDLIIAGLCLAGILWMSAATSSEQIMADARREGLLELTLTSPLTPKEFIRGIESGVSSKYRKLHHVTLGLLAMLAVWGALIRPFNGAAIASYCILWAWIFYIAHRGCFGQRTRPIWCALNLGRTEISVAQLWLPAIGFTLFHIVRIFTNRSPGAYNFLSQFPWGTGLELVVIILVSVITLVLTGVSMDDFTEETLLQHFREVAASPVPDPSDKRIANWDRSKMFPAQRDH